MPFRIDPHAERMPEDNSCKRREEILPIQKGAQFIYENLQDSGMERWSLTRAGQFLRQTGIDGSRYYVVPPVEACDFLSGFVREDIMDDLRAALSLHGIEYEKSPAPRM